MAKKAIIEVENRAKKILANKVTEMADLEERVKIAERQQNAASKAMDEATTAGDLRAYQQAKTDYRDAGDAIEMHSKRLDALTNKPLITDVEYEKGVAQIMAALGEATAEAKKRIVEHVEQIRIIAAECTAEVTSGNELLHKWQHELYKDDASVPGGKGNRIHMRNMEKKFEDFSVTQFASYILDSGYYQSFTGQSR